MDSYRILISGGEAEITEKKSRFIATIRPVNSEEEAAGCIGELKKKYWDAKHNCYAYVIGADGGYTRCSDDGEPGGTAGRPMLEVLLNEKICNVLAVVTRYFGGVLLGTGGLVRAYSQAVKEGLAVCRKGYLGKGAEYLIQTDYNDVGKILRIMGKYGLDQGESEYGADVLTRVIVEKERETMFLREVADATCGRAVSEKLNDVPVIRQE